MRPYFKKIDGPPPLDCSVERRVRFEEVDPLGIVWHGRYPSYFEDARVAHGNTYGIGYLDFYNQNIVAPIKQMHVDYIKPLTYGQTCTVQARLHWSEAAKLSYEFFIYDEQKELVTRGYSIQLMLTRDMDLLVCPPEFYLQFLAKWRSGEL